MFVQRRRARRWVVAKRIVAIVAAASLPIGGFFGLYFSPLFAVRAGEIQIHGLGGLVDQASVDAILTPAIGVPLVRLSTGDLAAQLTDLVTVRSATVTRQWPTGLEVMIDPRLPAAAVAVETGYVILDRDAVALADVAAAPADLPVIAVPLTDSNVRVVREVLDVLGSIPSQLRSHIVQIGADTQDTVHFGIDDGGVEKAVIWGDASEPALKAAALIPLLTQPAREYDVSAPMMPVLRQ